MNGSGFRDLRQRWSKNGAAYEDGGKSSDPEARHE
jgi:hypothetical protein